MGGSPLWSATIRRRSQHRLGGLPVYLDAWHVAPAVVPYPCHPCDQWFNRNSSTTDFTDDADATSRSAGSNYPGERRFVVALNTGWADCLYISMRGMLLLPLFPIRAIRVISGSIAILQPRISRMTRMPHQGLRGRTTLESDDSSSLSTSAGLAASTFRWVARDL
jgi:hypothetical protein